MADFKIISTLSNQFHLTQETGKVVMVCLSDNKRFEFPTEDAAREFVKTYHTVPQERH